MPKYEAVARRETIQPGAIVLEQILYGRKIRDESIPWLNRYGLYAYRNRNYGQLIICAFFASIFGGFLAKYLH